MFQEKGHGDDDDGENRESLSNNSYLVLLGSSCKNLGRQTEVGGPHGDLEKSGKILKPRCLDRRASGAIFGRHSERSRRRPEDVSTDVLDAAPCGHAAVCFTARRRKGGRYEGARAAVSTRSA